VTVFLLDVQTIPLNLLMCKISEDS